MCFPTLSQKRATWTVLCHILEQGYVLHFDQRDKRKLRVGNAAALLDQSPRFACKKAAIAKEKQPLYLWTICRRRKTTVRQTDDGDFPLLNGLGMRVQLSENGRKMFNGGKMGRSFGFRDGQGSLINTRWVAEWPEEKVHARVYREYRTIIHSTFQVDEYKLHLVETAGKSAIFRGANNSPVENPAEKDASNGTLLLQTDTQRRPAVNFNDLSKQI